MGELNLVDLVARSKKGLVTDEEFRAVTARLAAKPSRDAGRLLYVLGRSDLRDREELIAGYLEYPEDPDASATALSILCSQWGLTRKYRQNLLDALRGHDWDVDEEVRLRAISAAEVHLKEAGDCEISAELVAIATSHEFRAFEDAALTTLLRVDHVDFVRSLPPRGDHERAEWRSAMLDRVRRRHLEECGPSVARVMPPGSPVASASPSDHPGDARRSPRTGGW